MTAARSRPHAPTVAIDLGSNITIRPAPQREPPFDDERHPNDLEPVSWAQRPLPFPPLHPPIRHRPAVVARSPRRAAVPDPGRWSRRLLIGLIDVAGGRRPLSQLNPMLSPSVGFGLREELARRASAGTRAGRHSGRPGDRHRLYGTTVSSIRCSEPADGVAELCAVLRSPTAAIAVALRLEIRRGQWICTRLILG
ncbi:Rv3235 family protein [Jatrophihabitans sp.]|uniref:Rv3235 family protein n=1 Tax=Jatrophihabitans sp. TaxID=1932789 RepID=UPI0030C6E164|nr:hypothetical protein [Jatrophihabitans sp.]